VKLVDFGLATQVADADETATLEGTVVGTAAYMATALATFLIQGTDAGASAMG
jgi:hypothetical protein